MVTLDGQVSKLLRSHFPYEELDLGVKYLKNVIKTNGRVFSMVNIISEVAAYLVLENNTDNIEIEDASPVVVRKGLFISYMGAKRGYRRKGYVRQLVAKAKAEALLQGRTLYTYASVENKASINLLTSEGFKVEKITKNWIYFSYSA